MSGKIERLRNQLEKKVLNKRPYDEIYEASIALDRAINIYYTKISSGIVRE